MPTIATDTTLTNIHDIDSLEDDWAILQGPRAEATPSAPEVSTPVDPGQLQHFAIQMRAVAADIAAPRTYAEANMNRLVTLAFRTGLHPLDLPEVYWTRELARQRGAAEALNYVPRPTPSTPLSLRILALAQTGATDRSAAATELRRIANEIDPGR